MKAVLCGSPLNASFQELTDITSADLVRGQLFIPLQEHELDPISSLQAQEILAKGVQPTRWYVRSGELPDGTPRFVFACLSP